MKKVSVSLDEALLEQLDELAKGCGQDRSAVLREAVTSYLAQQNGSQPQGRRGFASNGRVRLSEEEIVRRYREGYAKYPLTEEELGWEEAQVWPD